MDLPHNKVVFSQFQKKLLFVSLLTIITVSAWFGFTDVQFLNDDFQITGWNDPESIIDCFSPFWDKDVSGIYYRPIPNTIHSINHYLFGNNPFPYHITNLLIYLAIIYVFGFFLIKLGIGFKEALLGSIFFSLLPSHELMLGWIAVIGDTIALLFILLATYNFLEFIRNNRSTNLIVSLIFFILACFSKEIGFFGVFIPLIFLTIKTPDYSVKTGIKYFLIYTFVGIIIILFRYFFGLGNLIDSPNLMKQNIIVYIYNFIVYILLSFTTSDVIEITYMGLQKAETFSLSVLSLGLTSVFLLVTTFFRSQKKQKRIFRFGIAWFIVFIIPAIPLMMQWYVYIASVGLVISVISLIETNKRYLIPFIFTALLLIYSLISFFSIHETIGKYKFAGNKTGIALKSLEKIEIKSGQRLIIWGSPDKINRVKSLKIGLQQAVEQYAGLDSIDVFAPLRTEHFESAAIKAIKIDDNKYKFTISKGRFLKEGGRSRAYFTNEISTSKLNETVIEINNKINMNYPVGTAKTELLTPLPNDLHIFYNGSEFKLLK